MVADSAPAPADATLRNYSAIRRCLLRFAHRRSDLWVGSLKEADYDAKAAPIYANALIGMVTFVGKWWTAERKPDVEEVAKHIGALAWMGLRHLPTRPTLSAPTTQR